MYCPGDNATDPIWRVLASSDGISSWTPLKPKHSNPNPNPLANQLWCSDFLTPPTILIIPHTLRAFLESLMLDSCTMLQKQSEVFHTFLWHFSKFKNNFIAYRSSKVSDCIFEIQQLWQSDFSRVYSNCCCSSSFEPEIIKIGQSSHKMYSNNSEFSRVYDNIQCPYKKSLETYRMHLVCILGMTLNCIWWWGSSFRAIKNVQYTFIAMV